MLDFLCSEFPVVFFRHRQKYLVASWLEGITCEFWFLWLGFEIMRKSWFPTKSLGTIRRPMLV